MEHGFVPVTGRSIRSRERVIEPPAFIASALLAALTASIVMLSAGTRAAQLDREPVNVVEVSERVAMLHIGDSPVRSNVVAVATERGIVVIDTHDHRRNARRLRKAIEEKFGRNDFLYVINTHHVLDHTGGNEVFADIPIIAHARWKEGMRRQDSLFTDPEAQARAHKILEEVAAEVKTLEKGTPREILLSGVLDFWNDHFRAYPGEYTITGPSITFRDRMRLDLGDITMDLVYIGPSYSISDIIVVIPEERLVVAGDMLQHERLPILNPVSDLERTASVLDELVGEDAPFERVIPGHREIMSISEVREQCAYFRELCKAVSEMKATHATVDEAKEDLSIENRFRSYAAYNPFSYFGIEKDHAANVENAWKSMRQ